MSEPAPVLLLLADLPVAEAGVAFAAQLAADEGRQLVVVATTEPRTHLPGDPSGFHMDDVVLQAAGHGAWCTPVLLRTLSPVRVLEKAVQTLEPAVAIVAQPMCRGGRRLARKLAARLAHQPVLVWHHSAAG